jgi:hypothetical protein
MADFPVVIGIIAFAAALFRTDQPMVSGLFVGVVFNVGAPAFSWRRSVRLPNSCVIGGSSHVLVV